ncbi:MAG: MvdD family ATP-grasp ribosomal peptide maturase [Myxococcaceae bacterium]|nr:MvdD family ATP-grasp ribosomal peptide maturase [Myxococcaceae bacterium]
MNVLLVTKSDDNESIDFVTRALKKRGARAVRLDTDTYPLEVKLSTTVGGPRVLDTGRARVDLETLGAIWYRRFAAGEGLPSLLGDTLDASIQESRRTLYGSIAATPCFQLDPLASVRLADHKELQLRRAAAFGLDVPRTLFSNDPKAVRAFARACGDKVITKMQGQFSIWREGLEQVVYTTALEEPGELDGLEYCPMTFQELVPRRVELRATVVGKRVLTASVESPRVDWRRDGIALLEQWQPYTLPPRVEKALLKLTRSFGLNYAAADFIVTPDGRHVFLEINAGGEFFWLERKPGLPIAAAIAEVLTKR